MLDTRKHTLPWIQSMLRIEDAALVYSRFIVKEYKVDLRNEKHSMLR